MRIVIAGGHGKIALLLARLLTARGDEVAGFVRNPAHFGDVEATGARPLRLSLEHTTVDEVAALLDSADATVFAAGAGPGSGAARKYTVDRDGSVLLADAAEAAKVPRFVQISSAGAGQPVTRGDEVWAAYIDAKTQAEDDLRTRPFDWTIVRPGSLTDDPATGLVALREPPGPRGAIPRADVAAVLATVLSAPNTIGKTLELIAGPTPIEAAVAAI
ncbi:NAD(P)H-binding protein [Nocardia sp. alder85J]|uniref:NAD(P)H-binding protein n=1 Tax=Nocardia sp. alder85J TaxID=2862949 RepID=UPI001CD42A67|nr:NAD(P)H-binding protein [Nocardia sp. alder85J]MCX4092622.1 NAD(P)H-binding protein [Nocardia sp. alder85J]